MRPKKYPQEPLAMLRAKHVDEATATLAKAVRAREEAERVERSHRKIHEDAEAKAKATLDAERDALERGELRAGDLARASTWSARVEEEQRQLERRALNASSRALGARDAEDAARGGVTSARADEAVVERDRARWEESERKRADAKEEEAASEAWRKPR
jgi:hypothetical protein